MKLYIYLYVNEIPLKDFAERVGVHKSYLSGISQGNRIPGLALAKKIEEETHGNVSVMELLQLVEYEPIKTVVSLKNPSLKKYAKKHKPKNQGTGNKTESD